MIQRLICPISGAPATVIFSRSYALPELLSFAKRAGISDKLADKPYEIRHCPASGLCFQTWVLDDNELAGLYSPSSDAGFFLAAIGRQKLHWFAHMTEEILVMRQMVAAKTPVVLDFGCNWGKWASMALAHGCDVYGVEVNCGAAAFCAARGIKMISREQVRGMHFDFINVDQVIEHLSDPLGVTNALADALKPGAFMKLGTPDNPRLPQQLRAAQASGDNTVLDAKTIDPLIPLQHVNLFSNASLKFLAGQIGLRPVRLPFWKWVGAGQLWNLPRQFNRNIVTPFKRRRMRGTYLWLQKSG